MSAHATDKKHVHTHAGECRKIKGKRPCTQFLELLTQDEDLWSRGPESSLAHYAKSHRNSAPITVLLVSPETDREITSGL